MSDTWIIGGQGTGPGSADNGGGFVNGTDATYANSQGVNGGPVATCVAGAVTNSGGKVRITAGAPTFINAVVGQYAYVDFAANPPADGRYEIEVVDGVGAYIEIDAAFVGVTTADVNVGGALDNPDDALALVGAGDLILIPNNVASVRTLTLPNNGGNAAMSFVHASGTFGAGRIVIRGCNNDGTNLAEGDAGPIITTNVALANGILYHTTYDCYDMFDLVINGAGTGKAEYCLYGSNALAVHNRFFNVRFCEAANQDVYYLGDHVTFVRCKMSDSVSWGARIDGDYPNIIDCVVNDNASHGIILFGTLGLVHNLKTYGNGALGFCLGGGGGTLYTRIINCLSYGNVDDGFTCNAAAISNLWYNNTAVENGDYGYNFGGVEDQSYFGFNHSDGNTAHTDLVADVDFPDLFDGNNITGDPLFASVVDGSEDFTPALISPLIAAAMPSLDLAGVSHLDVGPIQRALTAGSALVGGNKRGNKQ